MFCRSQARRPTDQLRNFRNLSRAGLRRLQLSIAVDPRRASSCRTAGIHLETNFQQYTSRRHLQQVAKQFRWHPALDTWRGTPVISYQDGAILQYLYRNAIPGHPELNRIDLRFYWTWGAAISCM